MRKKVRANVERDQTDQSPDPREDDRVAVSTISIDEKSEYKGGTETDDGRGDREKVGS
jgi:hypothetical protein